MIIIQHVAIIIFIILLTLPGLRPPPSPSQTSDSRELLSSFAGAELVQTSQRQKIVFFLLIQNFCKHPKRPKTVFFLLKQNLCKHSKDQNQYFLLKHNFCKHPKDKKQQQSTADQATTPTTTLPTSTKKYKNQTHRERLKTFDGLFHSSFYPFKPLCHLRNISIGMDFLMSC